MNDLARIRTELEERLRELSERANRIDEDLSQPADDDWDENAIESERDEVLEGVGQATMAEIELIQKALKAIENGSYGTCSACGGKIAAERLEALPAATACRDCA